MTAQYQLRKAIEGETVKIPACEMGINYDNNEETLFVCLDDLNLWCNKYNLNYTYNPDDDTYTIAPIPNS